MNKYSRFAFRHRAQRTSIAIAGLKVLAGMFVLATFAGCEKASTPSPNTAPVPSAVSVAASGTPGSLVEAIGMPDIDPAIRELGDAVRMRYVSSSAKDGAPVVVSGVAFFPRGEPPPGGWPVLAYAHGTSGILTECGPSLSPNLWGTTSVIAGLLKRGLAVATADYEGLGEPGVHAYLDARPAGWNVIDSVRALRAVRPGKVSDRWLGIGASQGGGAIWAATEQAATYAKELHLLGTVSVVPAANMAGYVDKAVAGTLKNGTETAAYVWMIMSLGRRHSELDMDLYRRGSVAQNWEALSFCQGPRAQERVAALLRIQPEELKPATSEAAAKLKEIFSAMALPQQRAESPMLVIYAGRDEYIESDWTRAAIAGACRQGSPVESAFQADKGHETVDYAPGLEWLGHRLAGEPVRQACQ